MTMLETPEAPNLRSCRSTLMDLPPEIHLMVISHLPYPDALSLKHSTRYFYGIVYTGIHLKIEWLISQRQLHLECPHDGSCLLNSDTNFCRGSVRLLMLRRRQHGECETAAGGRGCLVLGTKTCEWKRSRSSIVRIRKWLHGNLGSLVCVLVASLSILFYVPTIRTFDAAGWALGDAHEIIHGRMIRIYHGTSCDSCMAGAG